MAGRFHTNQKVGEQVPLNKGFVRKVTNFINNFEVRGSGATYHFDGVKPIINITRSEPSSVRPFTGTVVSGRTIKVARGYVFGIRDYNDMYMDPVFTFSDPTTFTTDLDTFDANEEYEVPANEVGYVVVELRYKILAQTYGSDVDGVIWRLAGQSLGFTTNQYPGQIDDYPSDTDYKVVWVPILFIETDAANITNFVQLTNTDIFDTFGGFLKSLEITHPT
jgi:hypothetical protein